MKKKKQQKQQNKEILPAIKRPDLSPANSGRIAQVFFNVDLRNGIEGLLKITGQFGFRADKLPQGHYFAFVNHLKDRFILLARSRSGRGWILTYEKCVGGRVDRAEMESVPQAFGLKSSFQTSTALASRVDEELRYKRIRDVTPS